MKLNENDRMIKARGNKTEIITIDEQNVGNNNSNNNYKEMNPCWPFFGLLILFFNIIFHLSLFCVRFVYAEISFLSLLSSVWFKFFDFRPIRMSCLHQQEHILFFFVKFLLKCIRIENRFISDSMREFVFCIDSFLRTFIIFYSLNWYFCLYNDALSNHNFQTFDFVRNPFHW